jgi:hypothetical protein
MVIELSQNIVSEHLGLCLFKVMLRKDLAELFKLFVPLVVLALFWDHLQ